MSSDSFSAASSRSGPCASVPCSAAYAAIFVLSASYAACHACQSGKISVSDHLNR